ncbi:hypothetical protein E4099_05985 [Streptomyces palmae]|uniref:Uncharacterized protein n=1 Tax=Streptomyces palmae TaxID=1701085 RepID=A0A4Z0HB30_9ACTN|nr:hypothetical protein E4099_05985 [Streptomyces palmae]
MGFINSKVMNPDRRRLGQGPLTHEEMATCSGVEVVPAKAESLRSKAKLLVARGWLPEPAPGRAGPVHAREGRGRPHLLGPVGTGARYTPVGDDVQKSNALFLTP